MKINSQVARKEYKCGKCSCTINKGDTYLSYSPKYQAKKIRCKNCYPKPSELTSSEKLSTLYSIQESMDEYKSIEEILIDSDLWEIEDAFHDSMSDRHGIVKSISIIKEEIYNSKRLDVDRSKELDPKFSDELDYRAVAENYFRVTEKIISNIGAETLVIDSEISPACSKFQELLNINEVLIENYTLLRKEAVEMRKKLDVLSTDEWSAFSTYVSNALKKD